MFILSSPHTRFCHSHCISLSTYICMFLTALECLGHGEPNLYSSSCCLKQSLLSLPKLSTDCTVTVSSASILPFITWSHYCISSLSLVSFADRHIVVLSIILKTFLSISVILSLAVKLLVIVYRHCLLSTETFSGSVKSSHPYVTIHL